MRDGGNLRVRRKSPAQNSAHLRRGTPTVQVCAARSFQWQSYVPTLALLVSKDLGKDITYVGYLYFAFVGTSIVSCLALHLHLRWFTTYSVRPCKHAPCSR